MKRKPASDTTNSALGIRGTNDGKGKDAMETVARMVRKIDVFPFKVGVDSMSGDSAVRRIEKIRDYVHDLREVLLIFCLFMKQSWLPHD